MLAQEIQDRRFATAFRGYDPTEVRQFLAHVAGLYGDMAARVARVAEGEVVAVGPMGEDAGSLAGTNDVPHDEVDAASAVRAEATLADAQRQADDLVAAARSEAQTIVSRASDEAARIVLRSRAESRGKPSAERNAAIDAALAEIPGDPEQAREQARLMITEARAVRERILADLAKRRRTAHVQLEQLRVAREKLLETLRDARRVVEDASRDLSTAEVEARLAAETAGRRVANEAMPSTDELEAELFGGRYAQSPRLASVEVEAVATVESARMSAESAALPAEASLDVVVTERVMTEELVVTSFVVTEGALAGTAGTHSVGIDVVSSEVVVAEVVIPEVLPAEAAETGNGEPVGAVTHVEVHDSAGAAFDVGTLAVIDDGSSHAVSESELVEPSIAASDRATDTTIGSTVAASGVGSVGVVDDLFARLRAERTEAADNARQVLASEVAAKVKKPRAPRQPKAVADENATESRAPREVTASAITEPVLVIDMTNAAEASFDTGDDLAGDEAADVDLGRDPADVAAVVAQRLARSIKRHLSDEQGSALVALRTARGLPHIDALVGTDTDQHARLAEVVTRSLVDAGTTLSDLSPMVDDVIADVRAALASALSLVREGSAEVGDLPEAIASVYRAWTTDRLDALLRRIVPIAA